MKNGHRNGESHLKTDPRSPLKERNVTRFGAPRVFTSDAREEKRKDDALTTLIRGLDLLIAEAADADLGTAARILHTAKEDLVYWAVKQDFHESMEERFINHHLYKSKGSGASSVFRGPHALRQNQKTGK